MLGIMQPQVSPQPQCPCPDTSQLVASFADWPNRLKYEEKTHM